jgi:transcriptional regulator with XRE-family HTH domain
VSKRLPGPLVDISPSCDPACSAVRLLRIEAGLSQRELARRMGVGVSSISSIESGRVPRMSTVRKLLQHLPGLSLADLFPASRSAPLAAPDSAWASGWRGAVLRADRVEVRCTNGRRTLTVTGVRSKLGRGDTAIESAMRALCIGTPSFIRGLTVASLEQDCIDGAVRHRFRRVGSSVGYEREDAERDAAFDVTYAIKNLYLASDALQECLQASVVAFPQATGEVEGRDLASILYPRGLAVVAEVHGVAVRVPSPLLGLSYRLSAGQDASRVQPRSRKGQGIRDPRAKAGLSVRAVAKASGLTHPTIAQLEQGADVRVSTLRTMLGALPGVHPREALEGMDAGSGDVWEYYRLLFGFAAHSVTKTIIVAADGGRTTRIDTRGLRALTDAEERIVLRVGRERAPLDQARRDLSHVGGVDGAMRVQHLLLKEGVDLHEVKIHAGPRGGGVSFVREYTDKARYRLHVPGRAEDGAPRDRAGATLPVRYPQREVRLRVQFPPGYEPLDARGHVWPSCVLPDERLMGRGVLPDLPLRLTHSRGRLVVNLVVRRPGVGSHISVSWEIPEASS